jgi:coenzyme Q-binding protein COQ10
MPSFETRRLVKHSPERMYNLVSDVERYPQFLPLCEELNIRSRKDRDGKSLLVADMTDEHAIDVKYIDGPFKYLDNRWRFEPAEDGGCSVYFYIDYEFKSRILGAVVGTMFDRAFRMFTEAFEKRADAIYNSSANS